MINDLGFNYIHNTHTKHKRETINVNSLVVLGSGQGVVPALLDDLAKFRKHAKKLMAEAKKNGDEFKENLHDAVSHVDIGFCIAINSM